MDYSEKSCEGVDCITLTLDRIQWQAFVKIVVNFVLYKSGELVNWQSDIFHFQKYSMDFKES
jgi:hypothetical protein